MNLQESIKLDSLVTEIFHATWLEYQLHSVIGFAMMHATIPMVKPKLVVTCKPVKFAGYWSVGATNPSGLVEINSAYFAGIVTDLHNTSMTRIQRLRLEAQLAETIAHELAHHLVWFIYGPKSQGGFAQYHGPEFRTVMRSLGYAGDTYHYMNSGEAKQVAKKLKVELTDRLADL